MNNESQAIYASGHMMFVRDQTLMAQEFDPDSLTMTGEAFPVAEAVLVVPGASLAVFGASASRVGSRWFWARSFQCRLTRVVYWPSQFCMPSTQST